MEHITVSGLNDYIKTYLEGDYFLNKIYLKGEISNLKKHTTGHWYFTLKDDASRINAVMFKSSAEYVEFSPEDGMNVLIEGRVSSYPASGTYQVYVNKMQLDGLGNLYLEYEKLKKKLHTEGLFEPNHKKKIPKYPKTVGVITASTGAAVRDIISTINRRFPYTEVILFPSLVQGKDAAPNIVKQIKVADSYNLDTIIVGRGGGSIEDLWAFNEEIVAHAIYECNTPIISAVGHEPDITISDYVADLRAPTPTGAAEMAVPTVIDTVNMINQYKIRLNKNVKNTVNSKFILLRNLKENYILKNPMSMYEIKMQKLDNLLDNANNKINNIIKTKKDVLNNISESYILKNPEKIIDMHINKLDKITSSYIFANPEKLIEVPKNNLGIILAGLKNLNPLGILEKGYSVVTLGDKVIKDSEELKNKDTLNIKLFKGEVLVEVKK